MQDIEALCPLLKTVRETGKCYASEGQELYDKLSAGQYDAFVIDEATKEQGVCRIGRIRLDISADYKRSTLVKEETEFRPWLCTFKASNFAFATINLAFEGEKIRHSNVLLFKIHGKQPFVEYFEPHGSGASPWTPIVEAALQHFLTQNDFGHLPFKASDIVCPKFGPQKADPRCHLWSLLYITLRIRYPHLDPKWMQEQIIAKGHTYLLDLQESFLCYLWYFISLHVENKRFDELLEEMRKIRPPPAKLGDAVVPAEYTEQRSKLVEKLRLTNELYYMTVFHVNTRFAPFANPHTLPKGLFEKISTKANKSMKKIDRWWTSFSVIRDKLYIGIGEEEEEEEEDRGIEYELDTVDFMMTKPATEFIRKNLRSGDIHLSFGNVLRWFPAEINDIYVEMEHNREEVARRLYEKKRPVSKLLHDIKDVWKYNSHPWEEHDNIDAAGGKKTYSKIEDEVSTAVHTLVDSDADDAADITTAMSISQSRLVVSIPLALLQERYPHILVL